MQAINTKMNPQNLISYTRILGPMKGLNTSHLTSCCAYSIKTNPKNISTHANKLSRYGLTTITPLPFAELIERNLKITKLDSSPSCRQF
jgi:hypothetical protein